MAAQAIVEEWRFIKKVTNEDNSNKFMYKVVNAAGVIGQFLLHFDTTQNYRIRNIDFYVHSKRKMWYTKQVTQIASPPTLVLDLFLWEGNIVVERKKIQITNESDKPGFSEFINDLMGCERDFISADRENRGPGGGGGGAAGAGGAGGGAGEEKKSTALRF